MADARIPEDELARRVIACLAAACRVPREDIHIDSRLEQLHIDSVQAISILFMLEEEFDVSIPEDRASEIRTVRDIVDGVRRLLSTRPIT